MAPNPNQSGDGDRMDRLMAEVQRTRQQREKTYRERALKLFPAICARCGREFSGKRLRELTVHHKDHNHENNPPDGSNWELLCIYCHDNEHARGAVADAYDTEAAGGRDARGDEGLGNRPFADLAALLKGGEKKQKK